jgi:hypothetical protein
MQCMLSALESVARVGYGAASVRTSSLPVQMLSASSEQTMDEWLNKLQQSVQAAVPSAIFAAFPACQRESVPA